MYKIVCFILLKQYGTIFQEQLSTGIIEIVPELEYQDENVHLVLTNL